MTEEAIDKVTVKVAAKALNVCERTVQRYVKNGLLSGMTEGRRVFIPLREVKDLRQQRKERMSRQRKVDKTGKMLHMSGSVTMSMDKYELLVKENEEFKVKTQLLLEYKHAVGSVKRELEETKGKLKEAEMEVGRLKRNPLRRLVEQVLKK